MKLSGEEYLRVSHWIQVCRVPETPMLDSIATAPARGSSAAQGKSSPEAKVIERVVGLVAREPDIREDIVASLRERIQSGTYHVTGEQIGEMMLRRMIADRVL